MKKIVILILILLPIVLVVTIAFAGQILSKYHHIPVEKVDFVDDVGDALDDDYLLIVNVGETKSIAIRIFPDMASNKKVAFSSQDASICTVDANGNITGVAIGNTSVYVTTSEGNKTDILNVLVVAERVTGITLPEVELTIVRGEQKQLEPAIEPYTAKNKSVTYESSDPTVVAVTPNGSLTALQAGEATVTVRTQDGGFTASCKITVTDGTPPLSFDMTGAPNVTPQGSGYLITTNSIDLAPYLRYDTEKIDPATIRWSIETGKNAAILTDTTLTFTANKLSVVTIAVCAGDAETPTYKTELKFFYQP